MSIKNNYKIKKSKLLFRLPVENIHSNQDINAKQKQIYDLTFRSGTHSNYKFKTINYKDYDQSRKIQLEKRKIKQKPLSLYLDGANPPIQSSYSQTPKKTQQQFICLNGKQHQVQRQLIAQDLRTGNQFFSSKKSLKQMILKQIQLKTKKQETNHKLFHVDNLPFEKVQQLFVLKKLNKIKRDRHIEPNYKKLTIIPQHKNHSFTNSDKNNINMSAKFSVLSQRNISQKNNKININSENQISQILLPSVQNKSNNRPLIVIQGNDAKKILTQSYIVLRHQDKKIISGIAYKKNYQIASLTKIMTFYTILYICQEYSIDYKKKQIQICQRAEQMSGTSAEIFAGEKYTLQQLFYGMMLPSGNDAAVAIANQGGIILKLHKNPKVSIQDENVECFVKYMNIVAKIIGMKTSNFTNPHGLPNLQNCSNAYQISLLVSQSLKFQQFLKVTGTKSYSFKSECEKGKRQVIWQNTHKLLRRQNFIGGKTGVTVTAGPCLSTIYQSQSGQKFIIVVLRAIKLSRRFKQTRWILGLSLKALDQKKYGGQVKQIIKSNTQLDSDNSQDEQIFDYKKSDSTQMKKRSKILVYEM